MFSKFLHGVGAYGTWPSDPACRGTTLQILKLASPHVLQKRTNGTSAKSYIHRVIELDIAMYARTTNVHVEVPNLDLQLQQQ
jgi:hypothetical protein